MNFGKIIKRNNDDFIVLCDPEVYGSGYNVVPKDVDPYNQYDIEEVRQYCIEHPEMVYPDYDPQPEPTEPTWEDTIEAQVTYTAMMTDTLIDAEE